MSEPLRPTQLRTLLCRASGTHLGPLMAAAVPLRAARRAGSTATPFGAGQVARPSLTESGPVLPAPPRSPAGRRCARWCEEAFRCACQRLCASRGAYPGPPAPRSSAPSPLPPRSGHGGPPRSAPQPGGSQQGAEKVRSGRFGLILRRSRNRKGQCFWALREIAGWSVRALGPGSCIYQHPARVPTQAPGRRFSILYSLVGQAVL